ncbi:MAG: hypothetical protein QOD75_2153 [Blastocatellia bacterium]|jgi:hypothetical protein|nr:hypothetical protein [Blastocatellia bacterium]
MSRRAAVTLIVLLVAALAAMAGYIYYRSHPGTVSGPATLTNQTIQPSVPGGPTPLPEFFESPGLVSRRAEPLRLYVAVARGIALNQQDPGDPQAAGQKLTSIPIVVVLENDTYQKVNFDSALAPAGEDLFTLVVTREGANGAEVFTYREPRGELTGWEPAERKTFTVSWPTAATGPGTYLVTVTPAFGKQDPLKIRTTLK